LRSRARRSASSSEDHSLLPPPPPFSSSASGLVLVVMMPAVNRLSDVAMRSSVCASVFNGEAFRASPLTRSREAKMVAMSSKGVCAFSSTCELRTQGRYCICMGRAYGLVKIKAYRSFMNNVLQDLINSNSSQARLLVRTSKLGQDHMQPERSGVYYCYYSENNFLIDRIGYYITTFYYYKSRRDC
jgi:hypothetical protein